MSLPAIPVLATADLGVPAAFGRLYELAHNLWWSWDPAGRDLWVAIDPVAWERYHNPIDLLSSLDPSTWATLEASEVFHDRYAEAVAGFDEYTKIAETWYDRRPEKVTTSIAYLCAEFGVHHSLPFYSGGLGILAGDHAKAASDLGLPMVGVGLFYRRGYFRQEIDADGDQQHIYPQLDVPRLPVQAVMATTGGQLRVPVEFPGRVVQAGVWKLQVGRVPLLLLDTDIPENDPSDRPITHALYVRGRETRFCQELVLGVGAVRALTALGIQPAVWHVNEGHAALSLLERLWRLVQGGLSLSEAEKKVKASTMFTLHTPVPAGNEVFEFSYVEKYLGRWTTGIGQDLAYLRRMGAPKEGENGQFDLGALAIRLAAVTNGVSKRHAEVVTRDWSHILSGPAPAVTNGVHTPTWVGRDVGKTMINVLGPTWPSSLIEHPATTERLRELPDGQLWAAHQARKALLSRFVRGRLRRQMARHGSSPDEMRAVESLMPADRLTLGFARRFATYKRATLMFHNLSWLQSILTNPERPVQVVFAGKAHPADNQGQELIRRIVELSRLPELRGHLYLLEDYEARMARFLVQGVDVWVNNPRPPMEASGTSGMKAAINGVLNLSILDGWWAEGFNGKNGWAFGSRHENGDHATQDNEDAVSFYRTLQDEVVPLYYERDSSGVPTGWVERMREAMISTLEAYSAHRMVADYCRVGYFPLGH
jgi:starch phosphorylase